MYVSVTTLLQKSSQTYLQRSHCKIQTSSWQLKQNVQVTVKYLTEPAEFSSCGHTKIDLHQSDGRSKVWRSKGTVLDPVLDPPVQHGGGRFIV